MGLKRVVCSFVVVVVVNIELITYSKYLTHSCQMASEVVEYCFYGAVLFFLWCNWTLCIISFNMLHGRKKVKEVWNNKEEQMMTEFSFLGELFINYSLYVIMINHHPQTKCS